MTDIVWDRRSLYVYAQTEKERFEEIEKKYKQFIACLDDVNTVPISVFNLKPKQIEELQMIREVSKELQKKKEDDINKAVSIGF
ncbi:unnamed protein product [Diatraea saccharalis]|uniref:Uncharacterized protein n=1 Tax=Diatraea saccharalis TaxID=40085 RepID=A0A9N9WIU9_9NEOP|nr:unnamed protein product [Diatraea saccharalis]